MRIILFFVLLFLIVVPLKADTSIYIHNIPKEGIVLEKGWRWQDGDNSIWSNKDFDDSQWKDINPVKDIYELNEFNQSGKIFWLRIHLVIDSSITVPLSMLLTQSGASEIYLNGNLIYSFGTIDTDPLKIKAYSPINKPLAIPLRVGSVQVLAIRFAVQPNISYGTHFGRENPGLKLILNSSEGSFENIYNSHIVIDQSNSVKVGVFLVLTLLYFVFYLFYPARKANFYFSVYALLQSVVWYSMVYTNNIIGISEIYIYNNISLVIQVISFLFMLTAVYSFLEQRKGVFFWTLVGVGIICIPCSLWIYGWGWLIFGILFTNLGNIDVTRIALKATRNKKSGTWIIVAGGICFLISWIIFTLQFFGVFTIKTNIDFFSISILSIPIAIAIYLGYDFALTNKSLEKKLKEIENLSFEKQQILASQNETLEVQVKERTAELKKSLENLKSAQAQLIQSEKMASLGELTAGIAHEIQNPLNFVNNFAEINKELLEELKGERSRVNGERDLNLEDQLFQDIVENEIKILQHGKRADAIVKGMLQHSRVSNSGTGEKEPVNINALLDEYFRLAYHGLRAKDKTFNAILSTDFDPTVGNLNIVPQDIGRVILNVITNAFYAVNQKLSNQHSAEGSSAREGNQSIASGYAPEVKVSTKLVGPDLIISVKDNGVGIAKKNIDKIFQPFFSTKPTGQGTGLGLSISYDIVKASGGELKVNSIEGEGTEFSIQLPIT